VLSPGPRQVRSQQKATLGEHKVANPANPVVYDKSKYHAETVGQYGLAESHASHHTLFFLRWLIDNDLMGEEFLAEAAPIEEYRAGRRTLLSLYEWWDCCLIEGMLSEEGNRFARHYFDFDRGHYLSDYRKILQGSLPSEYHVEFSDRNYGKLKPVIDRRYRRWKQSNKWWWPF